MDVQGGSADTREGYSKRVITLCNWFAEILPNVCIIKIGDETTNKYQQTGLLQSHFPLSEVSFLQRNW